MIHVQRGTESARKWIIPHEAFWLGGSDLHVGGPSPTMPEAKPCSSSEVFFSPSLWNWITCERRLYLAARFPPFPHLAVKWALWRPRSLSVFFHCANSSKCFFKYLLMAVVLIPLCSQRTTTKGAARALKVHFSFVRCVETAAPFFSLMLKRDPKHSFKKSNSVHKALLFNSSGLLFLLSLFRRDLTELILQLKQRCIFWKKREKNAATMQWKELFLCSAAFFSCTEKQIVHAVQFQWPYCGFWQWHRMTVWHLHCSAKIAPAVSPFAFKMPSLLAFYQPSDSGVTAGQAPSSAGLQWCTRHQILGKGKAVWDK